MGPSEEQLIHAIEHAPPAIQESLSGGSAVDFMISVPERYDLHLDTAGYISEFIRNMLLGFLRPEQFVGKLESIGITGDTSRQLVTDLNREVFIPLRDEMRNKGGGGAHAPSSVPHVPVLAVTAPKVEERVESNIPPLSPQPAFNLVREEVRPQPPVATPQMQTAPAPTMRTMQHDADALQHGMMPTPYSAPSVFQNSPHPSQMTPASEFQTASVPYTSIPTPSRAVEPSFAIPPPPASNPATLTKAPNLQNTPQIQPQVGNPSTDPYRETI